MSEGRAEKMQIEKNIPLPAWGVNPILKDMERLEVGDSFLIPEGANIRSFRSNCWGYGKKLNRKFAVRKTPEGGFRVWRKV